MVVSTTRWVSRYDAVASVISMQMFVDGEARCEASGESVGNWKEMCTYNNYSY